MVAAKILNEAHFLYGSRDLYNKLKRMLVRQGIPEKCVVWKIRHSGTGKMRKFTC
jgi:hypothetical protein